MPMGGWIFGATVSTAPLHGGKRGKTKRRAANKTARRTRRRAR